MVVILVVVLALVQAAQLVQIMLAVQGEILPVNPVQVSNALVVIVPIVLTAIVAINVQTVKLATHNAIQIINVFVRIYIHFQPGMCCHLHHCINNIQSSIHYI